MGDEVEGCDRADGSVDIGDLASVQAVVNRVRPEVVYHLAGWSDVGGSWAAPVEVFRANAEGTLNVLLACTDARSTMSTLPSARSQPSTSSPMARKCSTRWRPTKPLTPVTSARTRAV